MSQGTSGCHSREEIRHLQMEHLQVTLNRAYLNVEFYRKRMDALQLLPEDVASLDDLRRFPFTTRQDLSDHYPYGLFAEPLKSIVRLKIGSPAWVDQHRPIVVGFTRHDVGMWQSLLVRIYRQLGITDRDIVQVAFNFSLFPGAFTFNHAVEILGATLAPSAMVSATLQLQIMQDFRSTVLATTAAFALHMANTMERQSLDPSSLHLKIILLGPDPLPEAARRRLESVFGVCVFALYGVNEMMEPGIAGECTAQDGMHVAEDQFLVEIVHPATGEPLAPGHEGELVLTSLTAEAYPLIRYRSGDITVLREMPCSCGSTSARLGPILRRADNRISIRGIPIYPEQVEALLREIDSRLDDFRLVVTNSYGVGEQLEINLLRCSNEDFPGGSRSQYLELVRGHIRRVLGVGARVLMVDTVRFPKEGLICKTVLRNAPPIIDHDDGSQA